MMSATVLTTIVDSYNRSISERRQVIHWLEYKGASGRPVTREGASVVAAARLLSKEAKRTIGMTLYTDVERLLMEREGYVCPDCDAPRVVDYNRHEGVLFKVSTCSECDQFHLEEEQP